MKIIPAIDLIDGKCVRLTKGDYATKRVYNEDPVEVAKAFEDNGVRFLHLVDLDGAKSNRIINYPVLEKITKATSLQVDFGGGLKSDKDVQIAFESGAAQITGGSVAAKDRTLFLRWLERYGSEKIILGADCSNRKIATDGWLNSSELDVLDFIQAYQEQGIRTVISTDIAKDGMLAGPSIELYRAILNRTDVALIASGGITTLNDLEELSAIGCSGAIIGKAIYEGHITLKELSQLC
ncbi:MAG: 1-(5-phosphoribosyl)-5-[(5-phosphoribosylamino)methylideneamino]imidazole-4-carboxamide isomerase [Bacteroidetes bacterium]|nr:MAG: 1-(5-phosphoribosyl)-5-[(5-phosphoribosylamino)methylideneamino]imidazole-4-carboxamide isomerase [Bacteroidota bacterium]